MAKDTDAWMPLYVSDYLRDTRHLSTKEHGAYMLLIMHAWVSGGAVPADPARLARITGLDAKEWRESGDVLMAFFYRDGTFYRHGRINAELNRSNALIEQRRSAGKASAVARALQRESNERSTSVAAGGQRNGRPTPSPEPNGSIDDANESSATRRGSRLPDNWSPSLPYPSNVVALVSQWPPGRADRELDQFRDYWTGLTKNATKLDWDKTWHNRIRDQHDRIMRENRNGHGLRSAEPNLRGSRPDPALDLLRSAERAEEAERASGGGANYRGTWPALPSNFSN